MAQFKAGYSAIAVAVLLGVFAGPSCTATAQAPQPQGGATLAVKFPTDVTINKMPSTGGRPTTSETINLTLSNSSSAGITLQRPNDCETHVWTVTDSAGQTIDDRAICPMIFMPVTQAIAAHGSFAATQVVVLDSSKYQDGARYTLHYTFWGVAAQTSFATHVVQ